MSSIFAPAIFVWHAFPRLGAGCCTVPNAGTRDADFVVTGARHPVRQWGRDYEWNEPLEELADELLAGLERIGEAAQPSR